MKRFVILFFFILMSFDNVMTRRITGPDGYSEIIDSFYKNLEAAEAAFKTDASKKIKESTTTSMINDMSNILETAREDVKISRAIRVYLAQRGLYPNDKKLLSDSGQIAYNIFNEFLASLFKTSMSAQLQKITRDLFPKVRTYIALWSKPRDPAKFLEDLKKGLI